MDNVRLLYTASSSVNTSTSVTTGTHTVTFKAYDAANNVAVVNKSVTRLY